MDFPTVFYMKDMSAISVHWGTYGMAKASLGLLVPTSNLVPKALHRDQSWVTPGVLEEHPAQAGN